MFVRQICFDFMTGGPFKEGLNFFFTDFDGRRSNVGVFEGWRLSCRADGNQEDISSMSLS